MSVDAIRHLMDQGTAVSARRAAQTVGWGQSIASVSAPLAPSAPMVGASGQTGAGDARDDGFAAALSSALDSTNERVSSGITVSAASQQNDMTGAGGDALAVHAAYLQASSSVAPPLQHSDSIVSDTPTAFVPAAVQGVEAALPGELWEIQTAIPATQATPLVETPGLLARTGNVEADELVERVLGLRMGRGLEADAPIRDVASAQTALVSLGYDIGRFGPYANGVDGVLGPRTSEALQRFQTEQGLSSTGTLTAETATRLLAHGKPSLDRVSADWQTALAQSPFSAEAYEGTANPYWYVRFVAEGGDDADTMGDIDAVFKGRLASLARDSGQVASFGEGFRSLERQALFYQRYVEGTGALAAKPGQSRHNMGLAVDTQSSWLQRLDEGKSVSAQTSLLRYGLCKPLADGEGRGREPWHIEPVETRYGE